MNKLDEFLKKKVEDLAVEPRAEAWSKLESNLSKKNNGLIWFRAAAALMLVGLLVTTMVWLQKGDVSQPLAEQTKDANSSSANEIPEVKEDQTQPKQIEKSKITSHKKESSTKQTQTFEHEKKSGDETQTVAETSKPEITPLTITPDETIEVATVVEKPIVIEYTLESIPMRKKQTPVVAEAVEKRNSLQKAIDFAREAKNSDSPLGELRQAKDDLFALNFKKDKQKKQ